MWETIFDFGSIVIADIVLSGDNALIIGMAAAALGPDLRRKAIIFGMVVAALLRIIFALVATKLLGVPGLLFVGGLLLFWVCWSLYKDIVEHQEPEPTDIMEVAESAAGAQAASDEPTSKRTLASALWKITLADVSMSIDNVLAVAAIADGDERMLIFGLGLAILLMAFAATLIMKLLTRYPWISWLGLFVLIYVAGEMTYRGIFNPDTGVLAFFNLTT